MQRHDRPRRPAVMGARAGARAPDTPAGRAGARRRGAEGVTGHTRVTVAARRAGGQRLVARGLSPCRACGRRPGPRSTLGPVPSATPRWPRRSTRWPAGIHGMGSGGCGRGAGVVASGGSRSTGLGSGGGRHGRPTRAGASGGRHTSPWCQCRPCLRATSGPMRGSTSLVAPGCHCRG
jgi:hypothetical protein